MFFAHFPKKKVRRNTFLGGFFFRAGPQFFLSVIPFFFCVHSGQIPPLPLLLSTLPPTPASGWAGHTCQQSNAAMPRSLPAVPTVGGPQPQPSGDEARGVGRGHRTQTFECLPQRRACHLTPPTALHVSGHISMLMRIFENCVNSEMQCQCQSSPLCGR